MQYSEQAFQLPVYSWGGLAQMPLVQLDKLLVKMPFGHKMQILVKICYGICICTKNHWQYVINIEINPSNEFYKWVKVKVVK